MLKKTLPLTFKKFRNPHSYLRLGGLYCLRASIRSLALLVSVVLTDLIVAWIAFSLHHVTCRSKALGLKLRSQCGHRLEATSFMRFASERSEERNRSRLRLDGAAAVTDPVVPSVVSSAPWVAPAAFRIDPRAVLRLKPELPLLLRLVDAEGWWMQRKSLVWFEDIYFLTNLLWLLLWSGQHGWGLTTYRGWRMQSSCLLRVGHSKVFG